MNEKKSGCVAINIPSSETKAKQLKSGYKDGYFSCKEWILNVWKFATEDPNRVIFSFKVGLAVLLVSLLTLLQAPYEVFGTNLIWSILTVAVMFEYTVGTTFSRGFNRGLGSLLAVFLAIGIGQLAVSSGKIAEPIIIGISIFLVGTVTSFMKLWPSLVPYEYGFKVILFTYCLITISGYRIGNPIKTAMERMYSIAIGGFVAVLVNVLVFPMWAGEQLQAELVNNFNSVADSLEECVKKYLEDSGFHHPESSSSIINEFPDEPAYTKCKGTLNSSAKLESLASSARWEPPHGRFRLFFYPWEEYVKVGAVLRYCAYEVMALHGLLHSEIQAPYNLRIIFQSEIKDVTSQAAEMVRSLGKDISNMKRSLKTCLLKRVHISTERLQRAIDLHSYLLTAHSDSPNYISFSKPPLLEVLSHTSSSDLSNQLKECECNSIEKDTTSVTLAPPLKQSETYNEKVGKQFRRLRSWPSIEIDAFEEEGVAAVDFSPRMRALESTAALSLATFTSLLIEFVARLDHLVDAVDELSKSAKF